MYLLWQLEALFCVSFSMNSNLLSLWHERNSYGETFLRESFAAVCRLSHAAGPGLCHAFTVTKRDTAFTVEGGCFDLYNTEGVGGAQ